MSVEGRVSEVSLPGSGSCGVKAVRSIPQRTCSQVESENRAAAAKQKTNIGRGGWFGWVTGSGGAKSSAQDGPSELTEEEYRKIMSLVTEQEDALQPGAHFWSVQGRIYSAVSAVAAPVSMQAITFVCTVVPAA